MPYQIAIVIMSGALGVLGLIAILTSWYYIASFFVSLRPIKLVPRAKKFTKFAVIIPARYESKVIDRPLLSLLKQHYPKNKYDVWVIVESKDDPTCAITKRYGYKCFIRKDLVNKQTKGYAIQELINYFKKRKLHYDAYMIFDADNVISHYYLSVMNDVRQTGVQVGCGYRNFTNASYNWISSTSAVFFTYMSSFTSQMRTNLFKKATICGTGYYVDAKVIEDAGGWIFTGITEDVELTNYCYYHDVNMRYYPLVEFYDEQAIDLKTSHRQMIRWIMGYFADKKPFRQPGADYESTSKANRFWAKFEYNVGVFPFIIFGVTSLIILITSLILCITSIFTAREYSHTLWMFFVSQTVILYGVLMLVGLAVILKNWHRLKFNLPTFVWTVVTYPLFYVGILVAFVHGACSKRTRKQWARTDRTNLIINKKALEKVDEKR